MRDVLVEDWYGSFEMDAGGDNAHRLDAARQTVSRIIAKELTPRQREMLLLYFGEQYSMSQIAEQLQVNKSTVSRTIARGKRRVAAWMRYCPLR